MKCTECGQTIGADLHPRVRQAAHVATQAIIRRFGETFPLSFTDDVEEIIVTTLELAGLTEPKAL